MQPNLFFIVGVPRSGTTMLRELVGQHSRIAIPLDELQLLPRLIDTLGEDADFADAAVLDRLVSTVRDSNAAYHAAQKGLEPNLERLREATAGGDWHGAAIALVREFLPEPTDATHLGEKTPYNLTQIERFSRVFPGCRFVHVIRDPRDVCASMRKAWGKRPYRAACRWLQYQTLYERFTQQPEIAASCHALRYEDLVDQPEPTLRSVAEFLGLGFEPAMLSLRHGAEHWGAAAGSTQIERRSVGQHAKTLDRATIGLVESITWPHLQRLGYEASVATESQEVSRMRYRTEAAWDFLGGLRAHVRQKGLKDGITYRLRQLWAR